MKNLKLSDQAVRRIAGVVKGAQEEPLDEFTEQYLEAALWSSTDDIGEPLDYLYGIDDFSSEAINKAKSDCDAFREMAGELLDEARDEYGQHEEEQAQDFWLTREDHGAGFWGGDYGDMLGEKLTEIAESFGPANPYVGDDEKIYFM